MFKGGVYRGKTRDEIVAEVKKKGFDPILITNEAGYIYPKHKHPETKLLVFLEGDMVILVGGNKYECGEGDELIIPGNTEHSAVVGPDGCTFYWAEDLI